MGNDKLVDDARQLFTRLGDLADAERIEAINRIRLALSEFSPFKDEPVDCVQWVRASTVVANSYNPNTVAPPEMELLKLSVLSDGYTQPIVINHEATGNEVIDGFHRSRVGRECKEIRERVHGYLPIVQIRSERNGVHDRMASTVRHNRARGKHGIAQMSSIITELTHRGWSETKIAKELGMDADEVLRLKQITGLADLFRDQAFSEAWEPSD